MSFARLSVFGLVFGSLFGLVLANRLVPKASLSSAVATRILGIENKGPVREIIGFLPYWNLKSAGSIPFDKLTTIYYFAIDVDGDGNINYADGGWDKLKSPEYRAFREQLKKNPNLRFGITVVSLDADTIARLANNSVRQDRLIKNILRIMKDEKAQDLNLDLEYAGDLDKTLIDNYTGLVDRVARAVHKDVPGAKVSLDAYADAANKQRVYDLGKIAAVVDQVVIMGYDFHRLVSTQAGPIAPLFGQEKYQYDVYHSVIDYLRLVPKEKLVLAVPFYGYEWPTIGSEPGSAVISSIHGPEISSYKRSLETARDNNASVNFDDVSKSAWFSYFNKGSGTFRQVWFENERSLGLKFDLINQAGLAGAGIWALGYDGADNSSLWQTVADKLR